MAAPQETSYGFKPLPPSAPTGDTDLPPPYSSVVGGYPHPSTNTANVNPHSEGGTGAANTLPQQPYPQQPGYPQTGFTQPTSGYPHPTSGYPHPQPEIYTQQFQQFQVQQSAQPVPMVSVVLPPAVGSEPCALTCPRCAQFVTTRVEYQTSWQTHLTAGVICFATMFCSMCCLGVLPYCFDSCKSAEHYCPNCNGFIGRYSKC